MKKLPILLTLALQSLVVFAQGDGNKVPYQTKSLAGDQVNNVEIRTSGGAIEVFGGNDATARVEVYISGNNGTSLSKEEIQKRLQQDYDLSISVANHMVSAIAKFKNGIHWNKNNALNISFKVFVGKEVSTSLKTSGGSISLSNLTGEENFETSGGSLHVDGLGGKINGSTSGGSIHLSNSKDDITLETSGGSIEASQSSGNIILQTSGGSLKLNDLSGTIKAQTSGGSIDGSSIEGELVAETSGGSIHLFNLSCSLETSTSGGQIDVAISNPGKYVKISNSGGNIHLELPANKGMDLKLSGNKIKVNTLNNFSGSTGENSITGKLNGGGIPIQVDASSGRIELILK